LYFSGLSLLICKEGFELQIPHSSPGPGVKKWILGCHLSNSIPWTSNGPQHQKLIQGDSNPDSRRKFPPGVEIKGSRFLRGRG
jgi:hypothetical protein